MSRTYEYNRSRDWGNATNKQVQEMALYMIQEATRQEPGPINLSEIMWGMAGQGLRSTQSIVAIESLKDIGTISINNRFAIVYPPEC